MIIWYLDLQLPVKSESVAITIDVVSSNHAHGEVYLIQNYVINFVSDLQQVGGSIWVPPVLSPNKTDCHDLTGILLWH
jgi:hypothetical protein